MRQARLLGCGRSCYHCVSRVVDRRFVFGDTEKEFFVRLLMKLQEFTGVRVLTYCVMSNHFHVLLEVPDKEEELRSLDDKALLGRVQNLYGVGRRREIAQMLGWAGERGDDEWARRIRGEMTDRMADLSQLMKMLKQRFTMWYNRRKGRKGTLWEDRYRSVLIGGSTEALLCVAAYIDLNPVRAGLASDPGDYRWSGYGAAAAGENKARRGLGRIFGISGGNSHWRHAGAQYRRFVYHVTEPQVGSKSRVSGAIPGRRVKQVVEEKGRTSLGNALRVRVRYFSDGLVLGGRGFVEEVFEGNRDRFGPRRKSGARRMRGADWGELFVLRDLRRDVMGS